MLAIMTTAIDEIVDQVIERITPHLRSLFDEHQNQPRATATTDSPHMPGAVRAELARSGRSRGELASAIGISGPTLALRLRGTYPFKREELPKIAHFLGLTVDGLLQSAQLGEKFASSNPTFDDALQSLPPLDDWAQPPGSHRRRRR